MAYRLMIFGTASGVGKSSIAGGLCRAFSRRFKAAPFKALNLSSRSARLRSGGEIGVAQAMQAAACGIRPDGRMNPVLLKPEGERTRCLIRGREEFSYGAYEYAARNVALREVAREAYAELAEEYELIVMEGSGSCCEINLFDSDVANSWMAEAADAPALLVADVERGGVFAQVYGTLALLPAAARARIRGVIINKFHGNPEFFRPAAEQLGGLIGIPVVGILPFRAWGFPEEDGPAALDREEEYFFQGEFEKKYDEAAKHLSVYLDFTAVDKIVGFI